MLHLSSKTFLLILLLGVSVVLSEGFAKHSRPVSGKIANPSQHQRQRQRQLPLQSQTVRPAFLPMQHPHSVPTLTRGGALKAAAGSSESGTNKCPVSKPIEIFGSTWGSLGVVYVLVKSIRRVLPIALEPFAASSTMALTPFQWSMYAVTCLFFAYAEGYKGFHLKFSPLVVKRSFTLALGSKQGSFLNYMLAPLYSMGLIHATKKRLITSWCVSLGVAAVVVAVKRLPGVWRCIVDGGVIVGLSVGSLSILYHFVKAWMNGTPPDVDACLPDTKQS